MTTISSLPRRRFRRRGIIQKWRQLQRLGRRMLLCLFAALICVLILKTRFHLWTSWGSHHHKIPLTNQRNSPFRNTNNGSPRYGLPQDPRQQVPGSFQDDHDYVNNNDNDASRQRFLIFRPPLETAQGVGNLMQGLLAAHLLGDEFHRIVCVSPEWTDFAFVFDALTPECANATNSLSHHTSRELWVLNFGILPINQCQLRDHLQSQETIVTLVANTYPEWPSNHNDGSHRDLFQRYYKPRQELLNVLPWNSKTSPKVVVHLRQPDDIQLDPRLGLDPDTLEALGTTLPSSTFLVTNQVDYYDYFETNFGWSHPTWKTVRHSAKAEIQWTTKEVVVESRDLHILQLWSDWWTLYLAQEVYHTHSDFSLSATHWSGIEASLAIQGVDEQGQLITERSDLTTTKATASDIVEPLSQRTNLKNCDLNPSGLDGLSYVMKVDDEYHDDRQDDWQLRRPAKAAAGG